MTQYYEKEVWEQEDTEIEIKSINVLSSGGTKKIDASPVNKNREYNYIADSIRDAIKHFIKVDKRTRLFHNNSLYFYNKEIVDEIFKNLKKYNLKHTLSFRQLKISEQLICYEINFKEVLDRTKPEIF